jgi:hypothetical protein
LLQPEQRLDSFFNRSGSSTLEGGASRLNGIIDVRFATELNIFDAFPSSRIVYRLSNISLGLSPLSAYTVSYRDLV